MAIIKCKMCGGDLNIAENNSVAVCEYCGTQQTVPSADNEKKLTLFGRANRLRMACEFDKAAGVYESIVVDFPEEAEAYWGLVLCKYGIEYVDDPATGKKIPTCHRSSFDSVMDDTNFDQAMENADPIAQKVYREEAKQFERIRKGILEVSSSEKPYDIFICYKETDEKGDRTLDSVLAQDLYAALTDKGYRVFFSRITLQGKLGEAYEPYIFAALNSAKVMLAVGTCYEYYNAVWVKNEWSRYIKLCEADKSKHLIPCYKDLDPEDMPKEFKHLQGADLGKMGAVQDILFNMEKYISLKKEVAKEPGIVQQSTENNLTAPLIRRAFSLLEEGDWKAADACCERLLDFDSECAEAYLGKLMAKLHIKQQKDLKDSAVAFDENPHFVKAVQYAEAKGNSVLLAELKASAEAFRKKREEEAAQAREKAKAAAKRAKKVIPIVAAVVVIAIAAILMVTKVVIPNGKYNEAVDLIDEGRVVEAYEALVALEGYKDSYERAELLFEKYRAETLKKAEKGDIVFWGTYEQDNNSSNGKENIEWIVMDKKDNRLFLVSKYALDFKEYNMPITDFTWKTSSLRSWLNDDFLNTAFDLEEQKAIETTSVFAGDWSDPRSGLADLTEEKVFLLSGTEAEQYLHSNEARVCVPTKYAADQVGMSSSKDETCAWWLRSSGGNVVVSKDGVVSGSLGKDSYDLGAVRPAMWIDLNA